MPSGPVYWQSCPHSILLTLPPLSTVILKRRLDVGKDEDEDVSELQLIQEQ